MFNKKPDNGGAGGDGSKMDENSVIHIKEEFILGSDLELVSCDECKHVIRKKDAQKVHIQKGGRCGEYVYYCPEHKKPYDSLWYDETPNTYTWTDGSSTTIFPTVSRKRYFIKQPETTIEVNENGKPIKQKNDRTKQRKS